MKKPRIILRCSKLIKKVNLNRIAKCQLINKGCKGEFCQDRFVCMTNRFDIENVKVSSWAFYVKADDEGKKFVDKLRETVNGDLFRLVVRGRAKNRMSKGGSRSTQPLKGADYFAIYFKLTPLAEEIVNSRRKNGILRDTLDKP